jgi:TIGR03009 family protein
MRRNIGLGAIFGLLVAVGLLFAQSQAVAQQQQWNGQPQGVQAPPTDRQMGPQLPTLQRRRPRPEPPPVPFVLSAAEQAQVDRALETWESRSKEIRTFDCKFTRWKYDAVFPDPKDPNKANYIDRGVIKYAAPDKGFFRADAADPKDDPHGLQSEQWICDGKSIFQYEKAKDDKEKSKVVEYPLPPDLQGKAITDGPLPFLFGAEAQKLKQRYYLRLITPRDAQGEIWLEAYPRYQKDAAEFKVAHLILQEKTMLPSALQIYMPTGQQRTVYKFDGIVINDPLRFFEGNPFHANVPFGWIKVVEQPQPPAQASRPAAGAR